MNTPQCHHAPQLVQAYDNLYSNKVHLVINQLLLLLFIIYSYYFFIVIGLHFHVIGEGVVRLKSKRRERVYDKENYIDFRMRLLGEPGT